MSADTDGFKLGIWQDSGVLGDVKANLKTIDRACREAYVQGIDLVVFPEGFLGGYYMREDPHAVARNQASPDVKVLQEIAITFGVAMVIGYYEIENGALYNSALFIDDHGELKANYRKRALYGNWEKAHFSRGDQVQVVSFKGLEIGLLICFDVEFPELVREMAVTGIDLLVVPTALMDPQDVVAETLVPARALENHIYVAYANRVGTEHDLSYVGKSCIVSPDGTRLAVGDREQALLSADIEPAAITRAFNEYQYLKELSAGL